MTVTDFIRGTGWVAVARCRLGADDGYCRHWCVGGLDEYGAGEGMEDDRPRWGRKPMVNSGWRFQI